jgi:hypothetical protein
MFAGNALFDIILAPFFNKVISVLPVIYHIHPGILVLPKKVRSMPPEKQKPPCQVAPIPALMYSRCFFNMSHRLGVLKILLPVFLKMTALMDCIFINLYGKLYFHQYLATILITGIEKQKQE